MPSHLAVLASSSRGLPRAAVVDRYSAIRDFFLRQRYHKHSTVPLGNKRFHTFGTAGRLRVDTFIVQQRRLLHGSRATPFQHVGGRLNQRPESSGRPRDHEDIYPKPELHPPSSSQPPHSNENYSQFFRRLSASIPHLHRPTQDDFLNVATGFWQRLRVRFKWFTIRSFRKFNADDISAFMSIFLLSQTAWIFLGTTSFAAVIFATASSLSLQENLAHALSDYCTAETGVTVVFESAIVPKWKDSRISFKNVYISCRPKTSTTALLKSRDAGHHVAAGYDVSNHPSYHHVEEDHDLVADEVVDEGNYTQFDLNVDSIDVTLSLWRWLDGKGLVQDAVIKGVRGVIDRRSVKWDPDNPLDPKSFRRTAAPGDFNLESLQLEDLLVTIHQPDDFRPFTVSVFRADFGAFRKRWMLYDMLNAGSLVGQFDGSLFSLHRPQSMGRTVERVLTDSPWARMSRLRFDAINIDHMQAQTTMEGPISWITSGKIDVVLDIKFPRDTSAEAEDALDALLTNLTDALRNADLIPGQRELAKPPLTAPEDADREDADGTAKGIEGKVVVDIDLRFKDLHAAVPVFTSDLSYVSSAAIRPIVAFMNANHTLIPIRARVVKDMDDFDGSWTLWESGLTNDIAVKTYEAMAYHVGQANFNKRIRTVSFWTLQKTVGAALVTLRMMADPVRAHLKEVYSNIDFKL